MSKWALWAAHRYVHAGAAVPRRVGADGRLLRRPWRLRSPAAARIAASVRGARPQPWWPRPLGVLFVGLACMFALDPKGPVATDVAASSSARTGPRLMPVATCDARSVASAAFRWFAGDSQPPFSVVVLDEAYGELLRRDGIDDTHWRPDAEAAARLAGGGTFHWLVLADDRGRPVASPLGTFRIDWPGTSGDIVR